MSYARWFWRQLSAIGTNVAVRTVAGVAQVGFGLLIVWLSRRFIDHAVTGDVVWVDAALIFGALAVSIALRQTGFYLGNLACVTQQNVIRSRLYRRLLYRKLYTAAERLHSGDIGQRLERDIEAVSEVTADVFPRLMVTAVQLLGAFVLLHSMDALLAWCLLLVTPVALVSAKYLAHRLRQMTLDIRACESRVQMLVQETVEHEITLKTLESAPQLHSRMAWLQQTLHSLVTRRTRFTMISRLILSATFGAGYFGAFVYGGFQLRDGAITFGVMAAFLQLVSQIQNPILSALSMVPQIMHATASVDRLREIEDMEQEHTAPTMVSPEPFTTAESSIIPSSDLSENSLLPKGSLGVRFHDVSYTYPGAGKATLSHFSHEFKPGSITIITGETGCGKTTLLRLALGLIVPQSGQVELYDNQRCTITEAAMRHCITYIPQGNTLMSGSVRDNLLLAAPEATEEQMLEAIHTAVADFILDLPDGLDTPIGERAIRLSEGQMQRIVIARSLLRTISDKEGAGDFHREGSNMAAGCCGDTDALSVNDNYCRGSVLLLDEITSSLDAATEQTLLTRLSATFSHHTVIIVTHRPISITNAEHLHIDS